MQVVVYFSFSCTKNIRQGAVERKYMLSGGKTSLGKYTGLKYSASPRHCLDKWQVVDSLHTVSTEFITEETFLTGTVFDTLVKTLK